MRTVVAYGAGAAAVCVLGRHCAGYADAWCDHLALWGHTVAVQDGRPSWLRGGDGRPSWLRGGATTHALSQYGHGLLSGGRVAEAIPVLERQFAMCQEELGSAWPSAGTFGSTSLYLSLAYRLLGDNERSIAKADQGLRLFFCANGDYDKAEVEVGRILAARALAMLSSDEDAAVEQMGKALALVSNADPFTLALARQLNDHLASRGL